MLTTLSLRIEAFVPSKTPYTLFVHHSSHSVQRKEAHSSKNRSKKDNNYDEEKENKIWKGITELWDEIIEVSTYGPSERKILKAQRERQREYESLKDNDEPIDNPRRRSLDNDDDEAWINAFQAAKNKRNNEVSQTTEIEFDGYAMRDLLMSKWGAPLDIDFQSSPMTSTLYCTILPVVGYGSSLRSRHSSELDYLMHLQAVVEILAKYDNLDTFINFVEMTKKAPKRGTDSVPYRMNLTEDDKEKILKSRNGLI